MEVAELWVSPALAAESKHHPHLEVTRPGQSLPFDGAGDLVKEVLSPRSVRGRGNSVRVA
jgi:hypothetical protein